MSAEQVILLLGRRDHPTDGVADYCDKLRESGTCQGLSFESVQVPWAEKGWGDALARLRAAASAWRNRWAILQFTTLAWSRRGFPFHAPRVLKVLRESGVRAGVVFHDFAPLAGHGVVGRTREYSHLRAMRQLYESSQLCIFTVPVKQISWLPVQHDKAVFIPVGANCPEFPADRQREIDQKKTIAVYGVTGGNNTRSEVADISFVMRHASESAGSLRLIVFGRGSQEADPILRSELAGANVEIETLGLVSPEQVSHIMARSDVLLFVRGHISSRRGSAIAGIASGLPVVCYSGPETDWPVTEAGIAAVPTGDRQGLVDKLKTVLKDDVLRRDLADRSHHAYQQYFSWSAITARWNTELHILDPAPARNCAVKSNAVARI